MVSGSYRRSVGPEDLVQLGGSTIVRMDPESLGTSPPDEEGYDGGQPELADRESGIPGLLYEVLGNWATTIRSIALLLVLGGLLVAVIIAFDYLQVDVRVGPVEVIGRHLAVIPFQLLDSFRLISGG